MGDGTGMDCILAIDAGGSKCDAVLAGAEGGILGWSRATQPGVSGRGWEIVSTAVEDAVGDTRADVLYVVSYGVSGGILEALQTHAGQCRPIGSTESDAAFAHAGVAEGVVLLAGTGAFAHGRTRDGRTRHFDGTGPILGDFGGAYHIGLMALNAVVRSDWHSRHSTELRARVLERFGVQTPPELFRLGLFVRDRSLVASLARFVIEEARSGDSVACEVIRRAAETLSETFCDLVDNLGIADDDYTVVGTGGVIRSSDLYWETLWRRIAAASPRFRACRLREPPVLSLLIHALWQIAPDTCGPAVERLRQEAEPYLRQPGSGGAAP